MKPLLQTSISCDEINNVLLSSCLQRFDELDILVVCRQKVQQGVSSSADRRLTANIVILSTSQHLQAQQLIQQTKVWLYEAGQFRLQSLHGRQRASHVSCNSTLLIY